MITYAVEYSYGRRSPYSDSNDDACLVYPSGDVDYYGRNGVWNSYGFIRINLSIITEK